MVDSKGQPLSPRQRVRVRWRKDWLDGSVVALSEVTGMVCVRYDTEGNKPPLADTWWVHPNNVQVLS